MGNVSVFTVVNEFYCHFMDVHRESLEALLLFTVISLALYSIFDIEGIFVTVSIKLLR